MLPASVKKVKQPTLGRAGEMKNADWAYDIKDVALERRLHKKTAPMVSHLENDPTDDHTRRGKRL